MAGFLKERYSVISVGRVMTCVLGMIVRREREIRNFDKTPFYRISGNVTAAEKIQKNSPAVVMEWKALTGSAYVDSPLLYKDNGFKEEKDAIQLIGRLLQKEEKEISFDENRDTEAIEKNGYLEGMISSLTKKKEKKNPPLLYNLAEIQNDCSKFFKISPTETLNIIQELYEKRLVTYPRTDARVLSTAVAKEIDKNLKGLLNIPGVSEYAKAILDQGLYKNIAKTRYTDDKQITDHYAIIPTGQGLRALQGMPKRAVYVYETIVRRFLAIFYPAAEYEKVNITVEVKNEYFTAGSKYLENPGYLAVMNYSFFKKKQKDMEESENTEQEETEQEETDESEVDTREIISKLKKGSTVHFLSLGIREGETSPPKRYNSGSLILAMENAGKLIEDEQLREQIKSCGIGTSATRAEILNKLVSIRYLNLNKKTQIIFPTLRGEIVYDIVYGSISSLLNPELTASWEKGLNYVAEGSISAEEYMKKLDQFIRQRTTRVMGLNNTWQVQRIFQQDEQFYHNASASQTGVAPPAKAKKTTKKPATKKQVKK